MEEMELKDIERINKDIAHIDDILYFLNKNEIDRAKEILERDKTILEKSLNEK